MIALIKTFEDSIVLLRSSTCLAKASMDSILLGSNCSSAKNILLMVVPLNNSTASFFTAS
ncbi:hypothetical protein D9V67_03010 [Buchnera aphidicola (Brachycaudus cardui)]|uniref:Uncharacterized protein n=1 Tax=Buchnera aphidicola (Brachycaudus cardui) TaxID=557993 RepID=A0A4D6XSR8_9GAMM|nr:hypothetical protein [Buchnera aphidicola]QCI20702.1 hypothetical protein D9V67_03010 [Buchnera aphidicola (Brachycaudus cardui)]